MKKRLSLLLVPATAGAIVIAAGSSWAQQAPKPENLIKWRQSAYQVIAWNNGRIKASVEGTYNKDEVIKAANTIAALANTGLGALFAPGTETGKGWHDTTAKPALFTDGKRVGELATNFNHEANELAKVAQTGDSAAVKEQYGKLTKTCKACHDDFKAKE
jgi:cytochrome c556